MGHSDWTNRRKCETTHPWITFEADLRAADYAFWMALGAIQSKCEHVARALVAPETGKSLLSLYLAKGALATTAIEGNTLNEKQVLRRIEANEPLPESQEYLGREIDNIVEACNLIARDMIESGSDCTISPQRIELFNRMVLKDLPVEDGVVPGQTRKHSVGVADYRAAPWEDCEYLLQRLCAWINGLKSSVPEQAVAFAVIRAVLAHLYLAWIHPFGDGNGRTARLIEVQILLGAGVPMVAAHLLSNHYNRTRTEYYRQLSRASKTSQVIPFLQYAAQGFVDQLDKQIRRIRRYQQQVVWRDYVYQQFRNQTSHASRRQRELALKLGEREGVQIAEIPKLSTDLAAAYAGKTAKTLTRDVNKLVKMGLIHRSGSVVSPNIRTLSAFLPRRRRIP